MKYPNWSLFLFPIPAIVVTAMFQILVIAVAVVVAIWDVNSWTKVSSYEDAGRTLLLLMNTDGKTPQPEFMMMMQPSCRI